ncbi:unnamed protein product [Microthlaspi erraticum]|uniref:Uncharacterized protein n=1 Tax=Microthlaspi erraticum TaxID=1685480 RepID=A0A6D2KX71_9BRAS|nr:unnamed protein product [Microthlaspi erraticum]
MTKPVLSIFFFFFFTISLLLLPATASATGNATSGLRYGGCAPGDTVGECITAAIEEKEEEEEEGVEAVVRRIQRPTKTLGYKTLQKGPGCNSKIYGNCIAQVNQRAATCTYHTRCKR